MDNEKINEIKSAEPPKRVKTVVKDSALNKPSEKKSKFEYLLEMERNKINILEDEMAAKVKGLTIVIIVLSILFLATLAGCIFFFREYREAKGSGNKILKDADGEYYKEKITYFMEKDLENIAEEFSDSSFSASVDEIGGYQYLVLSTDVEGMPVKVYFQNEFPDEYFRDSISRSFIKKDDKIIPYNVDYSFPIDKSMIPLIVTMTNGDVGFVKLSSREDGKIGDMSLVDITTMQDLGSINFENTLEYYVNLKAYDGDKEAITLNTGGFDFNYLVSEETYKAFTEGETSPLDIMSEVSTTIAEDSISFETLIKLSDNEYLGTYSGKITYGDSGFIMDSTNIYTYVPYEFEDYNFEGFITPRESKIENPLFISGMKGRYALEYYKNVKLSEYDNSLFVKADDGRITYSGEDALSVTGIDVSKYQENISWDKVKADGIDYTFVRAGYRGYSVGKVVEDETVVKRLKAADKAGVKTGVYFFTQATTVEEGIEEAKFCIKKLEEAGVSGPIVFDTENYDDPADARGNLVTRADRTAIAKAFCETVSEAGYKPIIYANTRWFVMGINYDELAEYDFWYAYYGDEPVLPYDFSIWQYSSSGSVDGTSGSIDMDLMLKDVFK